MKGVIYISLLLLLLTTSQTLAQEVERRGFIGLGIGPSFPIGNFANKSSANVFSGHAIPGYTDTILNFGYRYGDRFGVTAALSYSEYFMTDDQSNDWWQVAGITAGPMYSMPINSRTSIDLKAMIGWMVLTPIFDSYSSDGVDNGLAVDLRTLIRYNISTRWAVFAEVGIQSSNVSFTDQAQTEYRALISGFGIAFLPDI